MIWLAVIASAWSATLADSARAYVGRPYAFGGRGESLDCMGLVFRAWTDARGQTWRELSVNPTEIVSGRQLGAPVPRLDGVRTSDIDWSLLRPGDVLFFLGAQENVREPSLVTLGEEPMWVWHMGIYTDADRRRFIAGDHFAGEVAEMSLRDYLVAHADVYAGLYVTRP
jgi:cell wall-associated NlpC family hydrolase